MRRTAVILCIAALGTVSLAGVGWLLLGGRQHFSGDITGATDARLTILMNQDGSESGFAKSESKLYIKDGGNYREISTVSSLFDQIVSQIDVPTFVALGGGYSRDKGRVYYSNAGQAEAFVLYLVPHANPSSFSVLTDDRGSYEGGYGRDDNGVYKGSSDVIGADPKSFSVLSDGFSKDMAYVYWAGAQIKGADPSSFSVLTFDDYLNQGYKFSRDAGHVYFSTVDAIPEQATWPIPEADAATFHIVGETNSGSIYSADKHNVFTDSVIVNGADPSTFQVVTNGLQFDAFDAHHKFLRGKVIQ